MDPLVFQNSPIPNLNTVQNFQTLLIGLLSPSTSTRAECLEFFESLKKAHLPFLIESLSEILFHLQDLQTKTLTLLLLRQIFTNSPPQELWTSLPYHFRTKLIQKLIVYSKSEYALTLLKHTAEVIIQFNYSIYSFCKKITTEFLETAVETCLKQDLTACFGLFILPGYFPYFNDYFYVDKETLFRIFEKTLKSPINEVSFASIQAFAGLIFSFENSQAMYFGQLLKDMLKAAIKLNNEEIIEKIADCAEAEPFFFYRRFSLCLNFCKILLKTGKNSEVKFSVCRFICFICENSECKLEEIKAVVELVQEFFGYFGLQVPESLEIDYLDLGSELISRVVLSNLEYLGEFVDGICENILLSGLRSYILGVLQLEKLIKCFKSEVLKISELLIQTNDDYGLLLTLKCIGNMWKVSKYSLLNINNLLSINLNALNHNSEILRLQAYKSLSYFIERGSKSIVLKHTTIIKSHLLSSTDIKTHLEPLNLLHQLLKRFKHSLIYHEIPEKLLTILNKSNHQLVLACLSELKDKFPLDNLINEILISLNLLNSQLDINLLNTWQILFKHFPNTISIYADQLFLPLLSYITESISTNFPVPEIYLQSLICFTSNKLAFKYLPKVNFIVSKLFEHPDEDIQVLACQLSVTVLKTMNSFKDQAAFKLAKIYFKCIWKLFIINSQAFHKLEQLEALKSLIETFDQSLLTEDEADWLINSLFGCMKNNAGFELMVEECRFAAFIYRKHPLLPKSLLEISIDVLTGYLQVASEDEKFIILSVLCEFTENCGSNIGPRIEKIFEIFLGHAEYLDEKIREQGVKGLGCYSVVVATQEFIEKSVRILDVLEKCILNEKIFNYRYFLNCKNSAVLTIGIIMMQHGNCLDIKKVLLAWIWLLPIQSDKGKEKKSEWILTQLLNKHSFSLGNLNEKQIEHIKVLLKDNNLIEISTSIDCTNPI